MSVSNESQAHTTNTTTTTSNTTRDLNEESLRIIKALKGGKDAESSWEIDVSDLLGQYLHMLETSSKVDMDEDGSASQADIGTVLNFSTASTIVSEATRVFGRKVDFLAALVDSTMLNLTAGAVMGQKTKRTKAREKKLKSQVRGFQAVADWNASPDVPSASELVHLPWRLWSHSKKVYQSYIPEELLLYDPLLKHFAPHSDESFDDYLTRFSGLLQSVPFPLVPRCEDPQSIADARKQCLSRIPLEVLPPPEHINASEAAIKNTDPSAEVFDRLVSASLLASSYMDAQGSLVLPCCMDIVTDQIQQVESSPVLGSRSPSLLFGTVSVNAASASAHNLSAVPSAAEPMSGYGEGRQSTLRSAIVQSEEGGAIPVGHRLSTLPTISEEAPDQHGRRTNNPPNNRNSSKKIRLAALDEHERIGADAPLKPGKTWSTAPKNDPYNLKLEEIALGGVSCLSVCGVNGLRAFLKADRETKAQIYDDIHQWKVERKSARMGAKSPVILDGDGKVAALPRYFPLYEELRRPEDPLERAGYPNVFSSLSLKLARLQRTRPTQTTSQQDHLIRGDANIPRTPERNLPAPLGTPPPAADTFDAVPFADDEGAAAMGHGADDSDFSSSHLHQQDTLFDKVIATTFAETGQGNNPRGATGAVPGMMKFDKSSRFQMHERVWRWREKVEDWISRTSTLGNFYVSDYVQKIAARVEEAKIPSTTPDASLDTATADTANQVESVSFRRLVDGAQRHEVCRLFLTTLILTNKLGLKIQNASTTDGEAELVVHGTKLNAEHLTSDCHALLEGQPEDTRQSAMICTDVMDF